MVKLKVDWVRSMTPSQCRAGRALINMSQAELAKDAKVGLSTVKNFETGRSVPISNNLDAMRRSMQDWGVEFFDEEERIGVYLLKGKVRARDEFDPVP